MIRCRMFMLAALVSAAAPAARAQDWLAPVTGDTVLRGLVAEAVERGPAVAAQRYVAAGAVRRIAPAGTLPDPVLEVGTEDPTRKFHSYAQYEFSLEQEVPWPGALGARAGLARAVADQRRAQVGTRARDVAVSVGAGYYRLRYLAAALERLEQHRLLLDAAVDASRTRYATGAAPLTDPLQARLARDRLEAEGLALQGEYAAALAALNALRGRSPNEPVPMQPLDAAALQTQLAALPPPDSMLQAVLARHPRVVAQRAALGQAGRVIAVERLGARPDFFLRFEYHYNGAVRIPNETIPIPDFWSAFLGVRLPVWAWRKQLRLADAARADSAAAAAELHQAELDVGRELIETAARAAAEQRRLTLLVDGVLPAARATTESARRSYQVGRVEFVTVVAVQDALFRAELEAAAVAADLATHLVMLRELTREESEP